MFLRVKFLILCLYGFAPRAFCEPINNLIHEIGNLEEKSRSLSPQLQSTRAYYNQKKAESYGRFTDFVPQAQLSVRKDKDFFEDRNAYLRNLGLAPKTSAWNIDYQWSLINYSRFQNARKTFAEKNQSELALSNKEKEFSISFRTHLLNYLLSSYKKAAVENSLKRAETGKKEAKLGFELGQKTKIDVLRSEANLVMLDSKKIGFIDEEQNAKSKFIEFSGLSLLDISNLNNLDENFILELINSLTPNHVETDAPNLERSPLLADLNYQNKINSLTIKQLTSSQYPELKVVGSFSNSADSFNDTLYRPYRTHSVAIVLSIPLFGGGNFISSHFEEYFAVKQNEYSMNLKKLETINLLTNTQIKIKALEKQVSSLAINVNQFEELYKLTQKSYQLGKSTLSELLEVQDNLLDSKISLAQTKINYYTLSQNYLWQAGLQ
jgi:outer membrane protein TolC